MNEHPIAKIEKEIGEQVNTLKKAAAPTRPPAPNVMTLLEDAAAEIVDHAEVELDRAKRAAERIRQLSRAIQAAIGTVP